MYRPPAILQRMQKRWRVQSLTAGQCWVSIVQYSHNLRDRHSRLHPTRIQLPDTLRHAIAVELV